MAYYELRWQQRFQNFSRSFYLLEEGLAISAPSVTERAGIVQFFEMTFELSWKVLKDFLEEEGFSVKSPREAIKTAFQQGYITDGAVWLAALKDRNLMTHTYDDENASTIEENIKEQYFPILKSFSNEFVKKLP